MKKFIPPVGESDFCCLRRATYGFVDKSSFIRDVLADSSKVVCFPRPRLLRNKFATNVTPSLYMPLVSVELVDDVLERANKNAARGKSKNKKLTTKKMARKDR